MQRATSEALKVDLRQAHRLVTHEDARFMHLHKVFGVAALAHFAYRGWLWSAEGPTTGLGLDDGSWATLALLAAHAALHLSSFQFALPTRRNLAYNTIWPEMRWHSMFFAYRSIAALLVMWLQQNGTVGAAAAFACRGLAVLATMAAADAATRHYRRAGGPTAASSSIRDNPYPDWAPAWSRTALATAYSASQVFGTLMVLFRPEGPVFWTLLPIQVAPLLMTLVKKGIIAPAGWHLWYSLAVLVNFVYHPPYERLVCADMAQVAAVVIVCRFGLRVNKYMLWSAVILWGAAVSGYLGV